MSSSVTSLQMLARSLSLSLGIHVGDFVTSMRKHRDESHRVRIFSEFAGVDIRRPQKALSLHIMVVHQVSKHELALHVQT